MVRQRRHLPGSAEPFNPFRPSGRYVQGSFFIAVFLAVSVAVTINDASGQTAPQPGSPNSVEKVPNPATPVSNGLSSGIEGQILIGPVTPVERAGIGNNRPYQTTINVLDDEGRILTQFQSDPDGRFRLALKPGKYTLERKGSLSRAWANRYCVAGYFHAGNYRLRPRHPLTSAK
jgi:hypothetical protein